jgi:protein-disulfide isomerase
LWNQEEGMSKVVSKNAGRRDTRRARQQRQAQMQRLLPFIIIGIIAVIVVVVVIVVSSGNSTTNVSQAHGSSLGSVNAPVKVTEFGDYQCPACGAFFVQKQPKISFTFVPFSFIGNESVAAAQGAYCAGDQGKYWQYHDALYNDQRGENQGWFSTSRLEGYAQNLGLNMDQFKSCFEGGKYKSKVDSDSAYAQSLGVNSTPTFSVDGQLVEPANLITAIDNALKAKGQ